MQEILATCVGLNWRCLLSATMLDRLISFAAFYLFDIDKFAAQCYSLEYFCADANALLS